MKEDLYKPDCIRTVSGRYVNVFEPTLDMIDIEDIAHALSNQCRFGGHLEEFYSVAQHSIACAFYAPQELKLAALLHDASEAYLLDVPSPVKRRLSNYKEIEDNLMRVIAEKYGFAYPLPEAIKQLDEAILEGEWKHFVTKELTSSMLFLISSLKDRGKDSFLRLFGEHRL